MNVLGVAAPELAAGSGGCPGLSADCPALGATGMRVHRSHWIAFDHVVRVARTARGTFLTLSDGSRVPVSRRRASEVQARLGRGFVVDPT